MPKFKNGDKVRIKDSGKTGSIWGTASVFTIEAVPSEGPKLDNEGTKYLYQIDLDEDDTTTISVMEEDIEAT